MKFLFISSDYKPMPGGVAEYLDTLARGLINLSHRVVVLVVAEQSEKEKLEFLGNYEEWVLPFPIIHDERPLGWLGRSLVSILEMFRCVWPASRRLLDRTPFFCRSAAAVARMAEVLDREKPDVVVLGYLDLNLYPLVLYLREKKVPYGIIAHDFEIRQFPRVNDIVKRGGIIRGARWIAANSQYTSKFLKAWRIPSSRIIVIHPPIAPKFLEYSGNVPAQNQTRPLELVTIARLVRPKGIDIVLRALRILDSRGIAYRYTIAGTGPERECLERVANELGISNRVEFAGYISDEEKLLLLRRSDVFVMVSRVSANSQHEGFGIAYLEAAACGIPAIGSRAGGIPEAVIDGETGMLVPQESPEKLANALAFLSMNPEVRVRMGRAAAIRAARCVSPMVIATRFQDEVALQLSEKPVAMAGAARSADASFAEERRLQQKDKERN
jgi:glycosyltransferase involved in cell wall biosynthesis